MSRHVHEMARRRGPIRLPLWLGFLAFLAVAVFFLWSEHRAHILGALPYVLLLLCPAIHLFMHGGHGHGDEAEQDSISRPGGRS